MVKQKRLSAAPRILIKSIHAYNVQDFLFKAWKEDVNRRFHSESSNAKNLLITVYYSHSKPFSKFELKKNQLSFWNVFI